VQPVSPSEPRPPGPWDGEDGRRARRAAWVGTAVAVAAFWLLATGFAPWQLFARGPFTADFYDAQARALSRGHLHVPAEVAGIEGFLVDGKVQLYYGIVPALARLPVAAVTDALDGRLVVVSQLLGLSVGALAAARLYRRARAALAVPAPAHEAVVCGVLAAAVGLATPLAFLSARAIVYHEAELWGAALALLGFERVVVWWSSRAPRDLAVASAVAALAVSTRGSSGTGPALALGLLAVLLAVRRQGRLAALTACAALVPVGLYAVVNLARFGTLFSVPFEQQLLNPFSPQRRAALEANDGSLFGPQFLPTALLQYLRPDTLELRSLLPWVQWGPRARVVGDAVFDTVDRAASLPVTAPLFLALSVPGGWVALRRRVPVAWAACLVAGTAATIPTLSIAFVAHRYLADLVPPVVLATCLGLPVVMAWFAGRGAGVRAALVGVSVVALAGAVYVNASLAVLAQRLYLLPSQERTRDFVALQYGVHDVVPGGRPPDVTAAATLPPVGPDGAVVVVGDCAGLYRSDGETWRALEHEPGRGMRVVVEGEVRGGTTVLASGDGWVVELLNDGTRVVARHRSAEPAVRGSAFASPPGRVVFDVVADPALPMVTVRRGDEVVLEAFLRPAGGPVVAGDGWVPQPGRAALCRDLQERLSAG